MVRVRFDFEKARPVLESLLAYSVGRTITREYQVRYGRRMAGAGELGGLPVTALGVAVQFVEDIPYEQDIHEIAGAIALTGLDDLIKLRVYGEPIAWFDDANSIVVKGLGAFSTTATDWSVKVDGTAVTVSSVEGTTEKATIHLGTAVSKGGHDVIITLAPAKKAFYGRLYVP